MRDLQIEESYKPFNNDFTDSQNGFDFAIGLNQPFLDARVGSIEVNEVTIRTITNSDN
jgi:hypothetical protein